jgi:hypothetical protein
VWAAASIVAFCIGGAGEAGAEPGTATNWKIFNVADTNADNMSDLLWVDESTDAIIVTLMRRTHVLATGPVLDEGPGECCEAVTSADFNHDGYSDVVWTNAHDGTMHVWLLRGTQLLANGPEIPGPPGAGWVVGNGGDTNADGLADAVWYDAATNRFAVYLMRGAQLLAAGPVLSGPPGEGWNLNNVIDANNDNRADIVWDDAKTNTVAIWLLDGTRVLAEGPEIPGPPGEGWSAITAADFNHDGFADVIWSNESRGTMAVWLLRGTQLLAAGPEIAGPGGSGWAVAYAGDTNGDGLADAVWQKTGTTQFAVWLMHGAKLAARGPVLVGP